ncbi:MAG TPA: alginate export family protein [Candidatus Hydrogenedentes bacterium]|nr:alginate export family protein [Candidatus Hydrogenedentota bacterium]HRT19324.1 alginate export family protein [Candidatus Hydrogenedentota bacterium]HRT63404.1 alginate export family protein [Candidatus Hydrogenedentota bacterium]
MKRTIIGVLLFLVLTIPMAAQADLQNVQVGGEIRLRANFVSSTLAGPGPIEVRYTPAELAGRPIGGPFAYPNNGLGAVSYLSWNRRSNNTNFVEQRTRLHVSADFTDNVNAFVEFDSYDVWGEDFRSDYLTGVDSRSTTGLTPTLLGPDGDVSLYQAYIEARELYGTPLALRIGRQELSFGSEFLVGKGDKAPLFRGLSFDAVRLTYAGQTFTVDAWMSKLAEGSPAEEDGDVDFYGIYGTCKAIENVAFDLYWLYLRDARALPSDPVGPAGFDPTYDPTELHTVGARSAGKVGAFDFEAEVAYQFGDMDQAGFTFKPGLYGDHDADADAWAAKLEVGYSFDCPWKPRLFVGGVYFSGEDNRSVSANPLYPRSSVSFNRLFSNQIYSGFVDLNNDFSNGYDVRIGVLTFPMEKLVMLLCVSYFGADDTFDMPVAGQPSRVTKSSGSHMGTESYLALFYNYSKDLQFDAGWAHWFRGEGAFDGNFVEWNGYMLNKGSAHNDGDYIYVGSTLKF